MSVSVSGSAGDLRITFCARIDHQDGQRVVEIDALEHADHKRLMQLLLADPKLANLLASFDTGDAPAAQQHEDARYRPSDAETGGIHHTPEPAPQQPTGTDTVQQDEPSSDRGQDTDNGGTPGQGHPDPLTDEASTEDRPEPGNPRKANHQAKNQETEGFTDQQSDPQSPPNSSSDKKPGTRNRPKSEKPESLLQQTVNEEGFKNTSKGKRSKRSKKPKKPKIWFTPTPRTDLPQYSCSNMGRRYIQAAQPEGRDSLRPGCCDICEDCIESRRHKKMEQYAASNPSPVSTVLECDFPNFFKCDDFAKDEKHKKWIREARRATLFNALEKYDLHQPWMIRLILDSPASAEVQDAIEQYAISAGARNVSVTVRPVPPEQFKAWVPHQFSLKKGPKSYYNLCRFSNGWAQEQKTPSDNRSGKKEVLLPNDSDAEIIVPVQIERAKAITKSWKPTYHLSKKKFLTPEKRRELRKQARRELQRARLVAFMDWIQRWERVQPEYIDLSRKFIEDYLRGEKPSAREWQQETRGPRELVVETARWLNGARDVEPALVTVAQRLGFIPEGEHPAVDVGYLTELTRALPPLVFHDAPDATGN